MRTPRLLALTAIACAVALAGCDKARPLAAPASASSTCLSCHGGEQNSTGAPPYSLPRDAAGNVIASGNRFDQTASTTRIEVGAHTRHMEMGVSCGACHVVPAQVTSPGHNTVTRATVTFKELAAAGNVIPSTWDPAVHTCTNYCHGASLNSGGTNHAPDWLGGAAAAACGTCHFTAGVTPPAAHPPGPFADTRDCARCHPDTVNASDGTINVAGGKHVNGQLDGGGGHAAGWVDPATHGPAANAGLQNCTVCHGTDFAGGASGVSCNACHATNGHPSWQTECTFCHGLATRAADATFPNVGSGTVVRANLASPPLGTQGENAITTYAVGAHEAHVGGGALARAALCSECHGPTLPVDTAHVNGQVVLGWGGTAARGVVPTPAAAGNFPRWSDTAGVVPTCTNFCHGATLAGGTHLSPKWNEGAPGAFCGSCHGIPLPYTAAGRWHVQRQDCSTCHPGYSNASVDPTDHIFVGAGPSGLGCTSCHGSSLANAAPPSDITGGTDANRVGAHQAHVAGSGGTPRWRSAAITCTECHPDNTGNNRHANGVVNIVWGPIASAQGFLVSPAAGTVAPGSVFPSCANYCHSPRGADTALGLVPAPLWTATGNVVCGSCHGLPPLTATHPANAACSQCHPSYPDNPAAGTALSAAAKAIHINGQLEGGESSGGSPCLNCHKTDAATGAAYGKMVSDTTLYHHVVAEGAAFRTYPTTAGGQACLQCHADHDVFNPTLNPANTLGRGANLRTAIGTAPTTTTGYASSDFSGSAGICLSCHAGSIPKAAGQRSDGSTATHPVDGAGFSASAHAYAVAGSIRSGPSAFSAICMKCHSDAPVGTTYPEKQNGTWEFALHTSIDRRLRNPMGQVTPTDDRGEDHCFRCHSVTTDTSPGGGPAKAVANRDYFNATAMTASSQDVFQAFTNTLHTSKHNVAGYDQVHQPTEAPAGAGGTKHVECEDCHEPHAARAGAKPANNSNLVWGPLTGVTGVVPTWSAASWTAPTAYAATAASTTEYQICFKCHSGANAGLATWGAGDWTDVALEFSPANQSRHPVASALPATDPGVNGSSQLPNAGQLVNGWVKGMVMTCSDCHGADAASPAAQGPHGSAVRYMLKGTNRAWPFTVAGATTGSLFTMTSTGTGLGSANGLFCRNCHPDPAGATGTTNAGHIQFRGQHGGNAISTCVRCHLRVPHGGKVSRLIATSPNTPARYQVSGQTLNLVHFVKNNAGTYSGSSWFGTTCSTHSGGAAAGEAW